MSNVFFPYRFDPRFVLMWAPFGVWPGRDGVSVTDRTIRAPSGCWSSRRLADNVSGGHITERYRWWTAIGARLSAADDGLTFGTNADRGVCIHFDGRVPAVLDGARTRR